MRSSVFGGRISLCSGKGRVMGTAVPGSGMTTCDMCHRVVHFVYITLRGCKQVRIALCDDCDRRHCAKCAATIMSFTANRCPNGHWL